MKKLFVLMLMTTILYTGYNFLQDDTVYHYEQITVHTGDTMWAIADRWADQDEDVREVIYRICETNAAGEYEPETGTEAFSTGQDAVCRSADGGRGRRYQRMIITAPA